MATGSMFLYIYIYIYSIFKSKVHIINDKESGDFLTQSIVKTRILI
jgi:hypothetical protein